MQLNILTAAQNKTVPTRKALRTLLPALLVLSVTPFWAGAARADDSPAPVVTVSGGSLEGDCDTPLSCPISASIENPPQAHTECTMKSKWTFSAGQTWEADSDTTPDWQPSTDGSGDVSPHETDSPTTTFTGTYSEPAFYETEVSASVTYTETNSVTGEVKTYGPYSSTGVVGNGSDTGNASGAQAMATSASGSAATTGGAGAKGPKVAAKIGGFKRPGYITVYGGIVGKNYQAKASAPNSDPIDPSTMSKTDTGTAVMKAIYECPDDKGKGHITDRTFAYTVLKML